MKLNGKSALVTGANGGIGQAIVKRLMLAGVTVVATDLDCSGTSADYSIEGDLCDPTFCDDLPRKARDMSGSFDILINNAGIMRRGIITDSTDEDFALSMKINVEAPFRICKGTIPIMESNGGGAIVNVASCWGINPGPGHPIYVMSKAALASLTQCLGRDHAHQNIRVNAVCPNEVDTPMLRTGFEIRGLDPQSAIRELDLSVPLGRIAQPEDIADVVIFLASPDARYMCGALVEVNGGKPVS